MNLVWAVAVKELRQVRRDPRTLMILLFVPAFFLFLYGYALNFDIGMCGSSKIGTDRSKPPARRELRARRSSIVATVRSDAGSTSSSTTGASGPCS